MEERMKQIAGQIAGKNFGQCKAVLDNSGLVWRGGVYVGQVKGESVGKPTVVGTYHTVNHGELQTFIGSTTQVGELDDRGFTCIVNQTVVGDAHMPTTVWWFAVKEK